jgi:HlyD family secretion protein
VTELQSRLDLIRQPARQDLIEAAQREVEAAEAERALAEEGLGDRAVAAPKAGRIDAVYLREGEYAGPGQPVLSLLPPENLKAVFFAPETELANLAVGDPVTVACDGCDGALSGVITHIGARAEFAPPVIYSEDARAKLVFRIEARAEPGQVWALNPGQPVQARLAE